MRRIILGTGAFGLAIALTHSLLAAVIAAIVTAAVLSPKAPTKIVMIHDTKTGETKAQPLDAATQRYINSIERKEKRND